MATPSPNWNLAKSKLPASQAIPDGDIYVDVRLKTTLPDNPRGYLPLFPTATTPENGSLLQYAIQSNGKVSFRVVDTEGRMVRQFNNIQQFKDFGVNLSFPLNNRNIDLIKKSLNQILITGTQEKIISSVSTPVPDAAPPAAGQSSAAAPGAQQTNDDQPLNFSGASLTDIGTPNSASYFPSGIKTLRYPRDIIEGSTDYLQISIATYDRGAKLIRATNDQTFKSKEGSKNNIGTIILPIPSNIQDGNSVGYSDGTLDSLTGAVVGGALDVMDTNIGSKTVTQLSTDLKSKVSNAFNATVDAGLRGQVLRSLAVQAASIIPGAGNVTPEQLLARQTGGILNPNMELLFNGVTLRSFKFSFKMTPRNEDEADDIKKIIRTLKINMAPQTLTNDNFLRTPNVFELRYMTGSVPHPFLHRFKTCALTDISVNYTGEGIYATYSDATPNSMIMDLTFKELEPIYNTDYAGVGGVGY